MWWLYGFYDFVWPMLSLAGAISAIKFNDVFVKFIMLGIVPGTNYQINFGDIIFIFWLGLFIYGVFYLYLKAQKIINHLTPERQLAAKLAYINLISL
jgi:hypothetical protein